MDKWTDDEIRCRWAIVAQEAIERLPKQARDRAAQVFVEVCLSDNVYQMRKVLETTDIEKELMYNSSKQSDELVEHVRLSRESMKV